MIAYNLRNNYILTFSEVTYSDCKEQNKRTIFSKTFLVLNRRRSFPTVFFVGSNRSPNEKLETTLNLLGSLSQPSFFLHYIRCVFTRKAIMLKSVIIFNETLL